MSKKHHIQTYEAYLKRGIDNTSSEDVDEVIEKEKAIEDKIENSTVLQRFIDRSKLLLSMVRDYRKGNYKEVPWYTISTIAFSLLYILNPLDLMPDFIPGVGMLDDLSVLTLGLKFIENDLTKYNDWKKKNKVVDIEVEM